MGAGTWGRWCARPNDYSIRLCMVQTQKGDKKHVICAELFLFTYFRLQQWNILPHKDFIDFVLGDYRFVKMFNRVAISCTILREPYVVGPEFACKM